MICDYRINFYDIDGDEICCWNNDIKYITDRIYECYCGVFGDISFYVKEHKKTDTLHIHIEGYKRMWNLEIEIDKKINSLATEINRIIRFISENTK